MRVFVVLTSLLLASAAFADEGQWRPSQVTELDPARLRAMGLELEPSALWTKGTGGRLQAAVNYGGCSAAFVSKTGLVLTNHHCAYGAIQAQSTVEHDYLRDGFLARSPAEELEAKGRSTIAVLQKITDVTARVRAVADAQTDDAARHRAVEKETKTIVEACERDETKRCDVAASYLGGQYELFEYLYLRDVRIVYAPPSSIGEYGGDIDNWMWPRHTGDFTVLRAYVGKDGKPADYSPDNVPYQPSHVFEVSREGVQQGTFVAVVGYPGHTDRHLPVAEVERHVTQVLPTIVDVYGEWIALLEAQAKRSDAVAIKVAAQKKSLANRHKNALGMIAGIERMKLLERRRAEEAELKGDLEPLRQLSAERRKTFAKDFLLSNVGRGANLLAIAVDLVRRAEQVDKPDLERREDYMERNIDKLWRAQKRRLRDYDRGVDRALLHAFLARYDPPRAKRTNALLAKTKLSDPKVVKGYFDDPKTVKQTKDPLIALARSIVEDIEAMEERGDRRSGKMLVLGPKYMAMLAAVRPGPMYPDANGTLRFSYATVKGYEPRDGLWAVPQTTLAGVVEKHTGAEPFDLPKRVLDRKDAKRSAFLDPRLGDVPVCFLSSGDTTGGNSGSPVIDGRGRLVGLNFDRVWENIAGDFGYNVARSRNVSVDVRYLGFVLEGYGADGARLLKELGLKP